MGYIDRETLISNTKNYGINISDDDVVQLYKTFQVNTHNKFVLFNSWAQKHIRRLPLKYQGYERLERALSIYQADMENINRDEQANIFANFFIELYQITEPRFTPKRKEGYKEEFMALVKKYGLESYTQVIDWDTL